MIPVTKPFLPKRERLNQYLDRIYDSQWLTNNGQLVQELTHRLEEYLGVRNLLLVANGTLALQIAYRTLGVSDSRSKQNPEAITTPFTFIATASSLKWEGVEPVFVDIEPETWCLDPKYIEAAITPNTRAIVPVHVFGNACDVEAIDEIGIKHKLKVIYDASHAFGVNYKGKSLLCHGDAATLSFHATKLFHTGEGGAIVFKHEEDLELAKKLINFGISGPETIEELGINAKMNELQAAMGLAVLDEIDSNLSARSVIYNRYDNFLSDRFKFQKKCKNASCNFSYYPLLLNSDKDVKSAIEALSRYKIFPRRYFYPSLEKCSFFSDDGPIFFAHHTAEKIICLPIYFSLSEQDQDYVIEVLKQFN